MAAQLSAQVSTLNPQDIILVHNNQLRTTSRYVASAFGKRHDDVLRKLKGLECSEDFTARNFAVSKYQDSTGRNLPEWEMTKDGFMFLVMGFTGKKAAAIKEAYIEAFNWMAEQLAAQQPPVQPQLLGEPLLNLAVQREIRRVARTLCGRHYNHYVARLTSEALKEFPEDPMEVALLAERIWINEQSRDEIDGVPVQWLQESYDCCIDYLTANKPGLHPAQKQRFLQHWTDRMSKLAQHFE